MKKVVVLAALFTVGYSLTQVTINANNFIGASDVVQMGYDENPSITHTVSGPNQTWDYGELNDSGTDFIALGSADWFSGASNFPTANLGTEDENGFQVFFRKSAEAFDALGVYGDLFDNGTNTAFAFQPYQRQIAFPSTYGSTFNNTSQISVTVTDLEFGDSAVVTVTTNRTATIDAWGSMTTPFGTFNVLRQHILDNTTQNIIVYALGFPILNETESAITHTYNFLSDAANAKYLLLQYQYDPETEMMTAVEWQMSAPVANLAVDKPAQAPELYPNPTSDSFQIAHLPKNAKISIVDNSGKTVMTVSNVNEGQAFSTTELSAGTYVVLVQSKFGISSHKLVVNKD
jgi:hypothetical protein